MGGVRKVSIAMVMDHRQLVKMGAVVMVIVLQDKSAKTTNVWVQNVTMLLVDLVLPMNALMDKFVLLVTLAKLVFVKLILIALMAKVVWIIGVWLVVQRTIHVGVISIVMVLLEGAGLESVGQVVHLILNVTIAKFVMTLINVDLTQIE